MSSNDGGFFNNPTRRIGATEDTVKTGGKDNSKVASTSSVAIEQGNDGSGINPRTRRIRPKSSSENTTVTPADIGSHPEFVVGWLVIVEGPGRGMSRPLGYGMNSVGREEEVGVMLNFGDEEISRESHFKIAYDHKNKKFYIQHGGGQNLTYLEDSPVLASSELHHGAMVSIGNTTLKFIRFCDDTFDWE